jgi:hypothetical protein
VRIADLHAAVSQIPDDDKSLIASNHSRFSPVAAFVYRGACGPGFIPVCGERTEPFRASAD